MILNDLRLIYHDLTYIYISIYLCIYISMGPYGVPGSLSMGPYGVPGSRDSWTRGLGSRGLWTRDLGLQGLWTRDLRVPGLMDPGPGAQGGHRDPGPWIPGGARNDPRAGKPPCSPERSPKEKLETNEATNGSRLVAMTSSKYL